MQEKKVIDFHVHPFRGTAYNLNLYPGTYEPDLEGMKRQLTEAGITHICGSVLRREQDPEHLRDRKSVV